MLGAANMYNYVSRLDLINLALTNNPIDEWLSNMGRPPDWHRTELTGILSERNHVGNCMRTLK